VRDAIINYYNNSDSLFRDEEMPDQKIAYVVTDTTRAGHMLGLLSRGVQKYGWKPILVNCSGEAFDFDIPGIEIINVPTSSLFMNFFKSKKLISNIEKVFIQESPSVVHTYPFDSDLISAKALEQHELPLVVSCKGSSYINHISDHLNQYEKLRSSFSVFVCTCRYLATRFFELGIFPKNNINVIFDAPEERFFEPISNTDKAESRKEFGLDEKDEVVSVISDYQENSGYEAMGEAFAELAMERPNLKLLVCAKVLYGERSVIVRNRLRAILEENDMLGRAIFVENEIDLKKIYAATDIYVQPSYHDDCNINLSQAVACGLPIVTTNVGGNSEVVIDGLNGFVVPSTKPQAIASALKKLFESEELRSKMGKYSADFAKKYLHPEEVLRSYCSLYSKVSQNVYRYKTPAVI
jgi:glycosyltransferase involved in cell wall biosynthesis